MERGNPDTRRYLETQILHFDGMAWKGYTYQWNDEQNEAILVPAEGSERSIVVKDANAPGGRRQQTWHFHSRAECLQCHNPWAGHLLAFRPRQLDRDHRYGEIADQQMRTLTHISAVTLLGKEAGQPYTPTKGQAAKLANPHDSAGNLTERARSYLHVNCAHCHQFGAGGTAEIDVRYDLPLAQMKIREVRPVQGTFEIPNAYILAPGDPYRSVLFYRMAKIGRGRMPHIGSELVDDKGLCLIHDWIRNLPLHREENALIEKLRVLDEPPRLADEADPQGESLPRAAQAIAKADGREVIIAEDRQK